MNFYLSLKKLLTKPLIIDVKLKKWVILKKSFRK